MFAAVGLELKGQLDLSYRDSASWDDIGPAKSQWIALGDPATGPAVQLGASGPVDHKLELPPHYHGSDQLRVCLSGTFEILKKPLAQREFCFQESGRPYKEALDVSSEQLWIFGLMGNARGARTTWTQDIAGTFPLDGIGESQLDRPINADDAWWDDFAGGSRGRPAIDTSIGRCERGTLWGTFAERAAWRGQPGGTQLVAALLGDPIVGPMVALVHGAPGDRLLPSITVETELLVLVIDGACTIGAAHVAAADIRIQQAGTTLDELTASPDGVDILLLVADRRALDPLSDQASADSTWVLETILAERETLSPNAS